MDFKKISASTKFQYSSAISVNFLTLGFGCGIGWLSLALPWLLSESCPLNTGPITVENMSWLGAIASIGAIIGNLLFGYIVTKIGSKNTGLLLGIPQLISWLLLIFGRNVLHLYSSRVFSGLVAGGIQICISLYVAEIADNDIRGQLGTIYQYARNLGILFSYTLGSFFNYITASYFYIVITLIYYASFLFLPSTPQYLLRKNKIKNAENSFRFYKGYKKSDDSKLYADYFEHLKKVANEVEEDTSLSIKELWDARRSFIQATIFPLLNLCSGAYLFLTYGSYIIERSGTHVSTEFASISMAIIQLVGTVLTSYLVDTKGRRFLLILSMSGCTLGHITMGIYLYLHHKGFDTSMFHWTPVICMSFIILIASTGIVPLTLICLVECFPIKVRAFGLTFGNVCINVFSFIIAGSLPLLAETIGLHNCSIIFSTSCGLGVIYMALCVEETKGKELNNLKRKSKANSIA